MIDKRKPIPMMADKGKDYIEGYMCLIDFECEMGAASGGNIVYPSIKDLKLCRQCVDQCGIVKVKVEAVKIVQKSKI